MGLRTIVEWCEPIAGRYERVLSATGDAPPGRMYHPGRYTADRVDGQQILLIDDTWTAEGTPSQRRMRFGPRVQKGSRSS
jgi:hypothetical protein